MCKKIISMLLLFWAGFVCAISFMEAWLKFRAEGVTLQIGLSIGKLVFTSLNRIELVFLVIVWILFWKTKAIKKARFLTNMRILGGITGILILQTFWLLPTLVERAHLIIAGNDPASSTVHFWFILLELTKVFMLITLSTKITTTI